MISRRPLLRLGVACGTLLTCAPLLGVAETMLGMGRAFGTLGRSGIGDPRELARAVAETLLMTASGLFLCPFGIVLLILCLSLQKRSRAPEPPPLPRHL